MPEQTCEMRNAYPRNCAAGRRRQAGEMAELNYGARERRRGGMESQRPGAEYVALAAMRRSGGVSDKAGEQTT